VSAVAVFPRPGAALTGLAVWQVYRGASVVTAVSAGMSALVATRTIRGEEDAVSGRETVVVATTGLPVLAGVWVLLFVNDVALPEAYTLPLAAVALLVGVTALRRRPHLRSWTVYGPALLCAFAPSVVIVLTVDTSTTRAALLAVAAVFVLIAGAVRRLKAPVTVGALVAASIVLYAVSLIGLWLVLAVVGVSLIVLGAQFEKRRRAQARLREILNRPR
jgi:hypothetical protein